MPQPSILTVLFAICFSPSAFAGLSQIGAHFPAQNVPLSANVITTSQYDASYEVFVYATQNPAGAACGVGTLDYVLGWANERGNQQAVEFFTGISGNPSSTAGVVVPMRVKAGTSVSLQVKGVPAGAASCMGASGTYGVYVDGFGFWPGQPQRQAGILEPAKLDYPDVSGLHSYVLDYNLGAPGQESSYVVFVLDQGVPQTYLTWADEYGNRGANCSDGCVMPLRAHGQVTLANLGQSYSSNRIAAAAIKFAIPGTGAGPLMDYEFSRVNASTLPIFTLATGFASPGFYAAAETISSKVGNFTNTQQNDTNCGLLIGPFAPTPTTGMPSYGSAVCALPFGGAIQVNMINVGDPPRPSYDVYDDLIVF